MDNRYAKCANCGFGIKDNRFCPCCSLDRLDTKPFQSKKLKRDEFKLEFLIKGLLHKAETADIEELVEFDDAIQEFLIDIYRNASIRLHKENLALKEENRVLKGKK